MTAPATGFLVSAPAPVEYAFGNIVSSPDPRAEMSNRLPRIIQPFLTWLTCVPAAGERSTTTSRNMTLVDAGIRLFLGGFISTLGVEQVDAATRIALLACGATIISSGMGIMQVVVFHYCAHGALFNQKSLNTVVGRAVSLILIFTDFDTYRSDHIQHHRAEKLITEEDEFSRFVVGVCRLQPGESKLRLWTRTLIALFSPFFHARFFLLRLKGCCLAGNPSRFLLFGLFWGGLIGCCIHLDIWMQFLLVWALPLIILLQIATIFRILCEHRFPGEDVLDKRGKLILCLATTGVFPGRPPPSHSARSFIGAIHWLIWWLDLVTIQLFSRVFVLVGDAPCHDFHHRRPASSHWPDAHHARQQDKANGCPGYPVNYIDVWGLFPAINRNLESLANAREDVLLRRRNVVIQTPRRKLNRRDRAFARLTAKG
jgi:hypothetical protein